MFKYLLPLNLIFFLLLVIGCSGSKDKSPFEPGDLRSPELGEGHSVLGFNDLVFDKDAGTVTSVPNRMVSPHLNVTSFLNDPICPGSQCLYFVLKAWNPDTYEYALDIYLLNPTTLSPWDPKVIFFTSEFPDDFEIRNADSWTTLYDTDTTFKDFVNPFIALGKDVLAKRRLPPYPSWEVEPVVIWFNPTPTDTNATLSYAVDINWPGHCREPYEINNIQFAPAPKEVVGPTTPTNFTITVDVWDWQNNAAEVSVYSPIVFDDTDWHALDPNPPGGIQSWTGDFTDIFELSAGHHEAWLRATSNAPTDQVKDVYQKFKIPVLHFDNEGTKGSHGEGKDPVFVYLQDNNGYADIMLKYLSGSGPTQDLSEGLLGWTGSEEYDPTLQTYDVTGVWNATLAFASDKGGQIDLYKINLDGTGFLQLTNDATGDFSPAFHPDYPHNTANPAWDIVFYSYKDGQDAEIYTMDIDGSGVVQQMTNSWAEDVQPCFFKDAAGTKIAFASNRVAWDNYEIFIMDPNTPEPMAKPIRITFDPADDMHPSWSPLKPLMQSEIVFMSQRNGDWDLYKFSGATSTTSPVLVEPGDQMEPNFSPNGSQIVFTWDDMDYFNLWTIPWDGNKEFLTKRSSGDDDKWAPMWSYLP